MKHLTPYSGLLLLFLAGCALIRQQPTNSYFSFEFENETYEIVGYIAEDGESANYLIKRSNDTSIFRVIDHNQNGIIDRVVTGTINLDRANEIYQYGIRQAHEMNLYKEAEPLREFELVHEQYRLRVQSAIDGKHNFKNRFYIYDMNWVVISIYWDDDSDGAINRVELGEIPVKDAQELYEMTLQVASENNRIDSRFEERFIINIHEPIVDVPGDTVLN